MQSPPKFESCCPLSCPPFLVENRSFCSARNCLFPAPRQLWRGRCIRSSPFLLRSQQEAVSSAHPPPPRLVPAVSAILVRALPSRLFLDELHPASHSRSGSSQPLNLHKCPLAGCLCWGPFGLLRIPSDYRGCLISCFVCFHRRGQRPSWTWNWGQSQFSGCLLRAFPPGLSWTDPARTPGKVIKKYQGPTRVPCPGAPPPPGNTHVP